MNIYFVIVFCKVEHMSVGRTLFFTLVHLLKCYLVGVMSNFTVCTELNIQKTCLMLLSHYLLLKLNGAKL